MQLDRGTEKSQPKVRLCLWPRIY